MEKVHLSLKKEIDNSYDILIGSSLLEKIPSDLKKSRIANRYLIITDSNIEGLFGKKLLGLMKKNGLDAGLISFKAGEENKRIETFRTLIQSAYSTGLDRKSSIIALGGGVTGDMAGFVAACYMRGISYIQVPTSLLAMTDSSIGGKVAVDLPNGKNTVGNFHQPKKVYIDVSLLKTLPKKELMTGLAEIIKHALIKDASMFDFIEKNLDKIMDKEESVMISLIKRNCEIKAEAVEKDEKEAGLRKLLNYGHTVGHAVETLTNYKRYSHGEAVAIGMAVEGLIANKLGLLSQEELEEQNRLIKKAGLPIKLPDINAKKLISELKKDKKVVDGKIEFALLEGIGKAKFGLSAPDKIIEEAVEESR
ncbi:3-dehydroquinate synthase [Candidatus Woesearchaeota archaeon]|nr:3-dehydroquinate synthase [Candidatus Woesearchaeota archaeon]